MSFDSQREAIPQPSGSSLAALVGWAKDLARTLLRQREAGTWLRLPSVAVADLPDAAVEGVGAMRYVPDEAGGPCVAISNGTVWKRLTLGATVS